MTGCRKCVERSTGALVAGMCILLLFSAIPVHAQGCALCYTQAASSGHRMIQALRNGIIILVVPPMFLSVAFTVLVYRKRNQFRDGIYPTRATATLPKQREGPSLQVELYKPEPRHSTLGPKW